ncbi:MAG TPA: hypothetical protein VMN56_20655 [Casimicrobiaceae bacterium]|nr:hypothetical protein [Casimicrobiaceae bacterium]
MERVAHAQCEGPRTYEVQLVIAPALPSHFPWMRSLLQDGAREGSFEADLATGSFDARIFFSNLHRALSTGSFLCERGGSPIEVRALGYVYSAANARGASASTPVGFALMKSLGTLGFELWLVAVDRPWRGCGHGTAMIREVLATPAGALAYVARLNDAGRCSHVILDILCGAGYAVARTGGGVQWLVRRDAPDMILRAVCGRAQHATHGAARSTS